MICLQIRLDFASHTYDPLFLGRHYLPGQKVRGRPHRIKVVLFIFQLQPCMIAATVYNQPSCLFVICSGWKNFPQQLRFPNYSVYQFIQTNHETLVINLKQLVTSVEVQLIDQKVFNTKNQNYKLIPDPLNAKYSTFEL